METVAAAGICRGRSHGLGVLLPCLATPAFSLTREKRGRVPCTVSQSTVSRQHTAPGNGAAKLPRSQTQKPEAIALKRRLLSALAHRSLGDSRSSPSQVRPSQFRLLPARRSLFSLRAWLASLCVLRVRSLPIAGDRLVLKHLMTHALLHTPLSAPHSTDRRFACMHTLQAVLPCQCGSRCFALPLILLSAAMALGFGGDKPDVSGVTSFDKQKLKKTPVQEKNPLPSGDGESTVFVSMLLGGVVWVN